MILSKKANNKGADQSAAGMRLCLFANPKDRFSRVKAQIKHCCCLFEIGFFLSYNTGMIKF